VNKKPNLPLGSEEINVAKEQSTCVLMKVPPLPRGMKREEWRYMLAMYAPKPFPEDTWFLMSTGRWQQKRYGQRMAYDHCVVAIHRDDVEEKDERGVMTEIAANSKYCAHLVNVDLPCDSPERFLCALGGGRECVGRCSEEAVVSGEADDEVTGVEVHYDYTKSIAKNCPFYTE